MTTIECQPVANPGERRVCCRCGRTFILSLWEYRLFSANSTKHKTACPACGEKLLPLARATARRHVQTEVD
jgi:DNA-directed RNA polymerase subunit RPC12/RpoP